jgi:signal transduction histidine kinase
MKFFTKLFLCAVLVLTAALSFAEYFTVSSSLDNAVNYQVESGLQQHQLVKYALQSGIITAARSGSVSENTFSAVAEQTADAMGVSLSLSATDGNELYSNAIPDLVEADQVEMETTDGAITYCIREVQTLSSVGRSLFMVSTFNQNGYTLQLTTVQDVTSVFSEAAALQKHCQQVFFLATMAGSLAMLVLAWLLTQPIKRLDRASRAFAEGNYDKRLATRSRDEIGDLTRTYNWMADNIEDKIEALELAVRQREDFVANFAHELKTPMTSIIGYADTLYQKQLTPQQVHEAAGYIANEGMRLEALSFKLMELITMERQNFLLEEMEMKELFQDVRETVLPLAQKRGIELSVHAAEGYARIEYDLFKTLLLNLLDNALKSGGSRVQMNGWVEGERYYIAVMDNGRGIPVDQLDRITEAFYMVDKSRSRKEHGAGLGLALCAKIAAIHGTKLDYASEEGQGTSVELALPLCPAMDEEG